MSAFVQAVQVSVSGLMSEVGVALQDRSFNLTMVSVWALGINPTTKLLSLVVSLFVWYLGNSQKHMTWEEKTMKGSSGYGNFGS